MTETSRTDKYGFPIDTCTRCLGSGHYSYNQVHGTRCFGCGGTGVQVVKKAKPAFVAFHTNAQNLKRTLTRDLVVGVAYRIYGSKAERKVVVAVEKTDEVCGGYKSGNDPYVYDYFHLVTFEDGTVEKKSATLIWSRLITLADLNVDFYLAQIPQRKVKK